MTEHRKHNRHTIRLLNHIFTTLVCLPTFCKYLLHCFMGEKVRKLVREVEIERG